MHELLFQSCRHNWCIIFHVCTYTGQWACVPIVYVTTWKRLPGVMEKATVRYGNNNLHYDEKVVLDSVTKLHRKENCNATWSLQISESIQLSQSRDYRRPLMWICDQRPAQLRREIQTSNANKSERNTVAWSVVCRTLITPFCLSSTENWAVRTYVRMYVCMPLCELLHYSLTINHYLLMVILTRFTVC